jgi:CheY-like chemotaxis protein
MSDQRVLIVDDEQRTLMFMHESLVVAGLNAEFVCVSSAEEALQALGQRPFDVVILDVRLPGMNGLQLLEQLHEMTSGARVILVSAYQDADIEAAARAMGAYHFFRKPFAFEEFTGTVANALREASMDMNRSQQAANWPTQFIQRQLTALVRDTGAQGVLLTHRSGAVIAGIGSTNGFDEPTLVPAANGESAFNFAYYQSKTHDVYSAQVGNGMRLSLVFDRNQPGSRIGLVLQYTRRTVQDISTALAALDQPAAHTA